MAVNPQSALRYLAIATSEGEFVAGYSETGLAEMSFPGRHLKGLTKHQNVPARVADLHTQTVAALKAILAGRAPAKLPPLDLSSGTEFQQSVWAGMCQIKFGQTQSYGELASAIGNPKAVRAVGGACGANPIPVIVPCHRVLAANNRMGGFSSGLEWKRRLHACENIHALE